MTHRLSPTVALPALTTLHMSTATRTAEALRVLRDVYFYFPRTPSWTPVGTDQTVPAFKHTMFETVPIPQPERTLRLVHHDGVPDSGYASAEEDSPYEDANDAGGRNGIDEEEVEQLDELRSDVLERNYAIKWLTGLVKRGDAWVCGASSSEEQEARTTCLEEASTLLARFAGDDVTEESVIRTFVFPFCMPSCRVCRDGGTALQAPPIMVELNDAPVDPMDYTSVGLQSWGSAIVFAQRICSDPERYFGILHLCTRTRSMESGTETYLPPRRVLELGAGTGLLSITAAQIFARTNVQAEVKATDYHPSVLENLARNVRHNHNAMGVAVEKLDWCAMTCTGGAVYDVVLAADVVYHPEHAHWIRECVERTLDKGGVFWLMIPIRLTGRHEGLSSTVEEAFPFADESEGSEEHLRVVKREKVERMDGVGRVDEGEYMLFEIRWT